MFKKLQSRFTTTKRRLKQDRLNKRQLQNAINNSDSDGDNRLYTTTAHGSDSGEDSFSSDDDDDNFLNKVTQSTDNISKKDTGDKKSDDKKVDDKKGDGKKDDKATKDSKENDKDQHSLQHLHNVHDRLFPEERDFIRQRQHFNHIDHILSLFHNNLTSFLNFFEQSQTFLLLLSSDLSSLTSTDSIYHSTFDTFTHTMKDMNNTLQNTNPSTKNLRRDIENAIIKPLTSHLSNLSEINRAIKKRENRMIDIQYYHMKCTKYRELLYGPGSTKDQQNGKDKDKLNHKDSEKDSVNDQENSQYPNDEDYGMGTFSHPDFSGNNPLTTNFPLYTTLSTDAAQEKQPVVTNQSLSLADINEIKKKMLKMTKKLHSTQYEYSIITKSLLSWFEQTVNFANQISLNFMLFITNYEESKMINLLPNLQVLLCILKQNIMYSKELKQIEVDYFVENGNYSQIVPSVSSTPANTTTITSTNLKNSNNFDRISPISSDNPNNAVITHSHPLYYKPSINYQSNNKEKVTDESLALLSTFFDLPEQLAWENNLCDGSTLLKITLPPQRNIEDPPISKQDNDDTHDYHSDDDTPSEDDPITTSLATCVLTATTTIPPIAENIEDPSFYPTIPLPTPVVTSAAPSTIPAPARPERPRRLSEVPPLLPLQTAPATASQEQFQHSLAQYHNLLERSDNEEGEDPAIISPDNDKSVSDNQHLLSEGYCDLNVRVIENTPLSTSPNKTLGENSVHFMKKYQRLADQFSSSDSNDDVTLSITKKPVDVMMRYQQLKDKKQKIKKIVHFYSDDNSDDKYSHDLDSTGGNIDNTFSEQQLTQQKRDITSHDLFSYQTKLLPDVTQSTSTIWDTMSENILIQYTNRHNYDHNSTLATNAAETHDTYASLGGISNDDMINIYSEQCKFKDLYINSTLFTEVSLNYRNTRSFEDYVNLLDNDTNRNGQSDDIVDLYNIFGVTKDKSQHLDQLPTQSSPESDDDLSAVLHTQASTVGELPVSASIANVSSIAAAPIITMNDAELTVPDTRRRRKSSLKSSAITFNLNNMNVKTLYKRTLDKNDKVYLEKLFLSSDHNIITQLDSDAENNDNEVDDCTDMYQFNEFVQNQGTFFPITLPMLYHHNYKKANQLIKDDYNHDFLWANNINTTDFDTDYSYDFSNYYYDYSASEYDLPMLTYGTEHVLVAAPISNPTRIDSAPGSTSTQGEDDGLLTLTSFDEDLLRKMNDPVDFRRPAISSSSKQATINNSAPCPKVIPPNTILHNISSHPIKPHPRLVGNKQLYCHKIRVNMPYTDPKLRLPPTPILKSRNAELKSSQPTLPPPSVPLTVPTKHPITTANNTINNIVVSTDTSSSHHLSTPSHASAISTFSFGGDHHHHHHHHLPRTAASTSGIHAPNFYFNPTSQNTSESSSLSSSSSIDLTSPNSQFTQPNHIPTNHSRQSHQPTQYYSNTDLDNDQVIFNNPLRVSMVGPLVYPTTTKQHDSYYPNSNTDLHLHASHSDYIHDDDGLPHKNVTGNNHRTSYNDALFATGIGDRSTDDEMLSTRLSSYDGVSSQATSMDQTLCNLRRNNTLLPSQNNDGTQVDKLPQKLGPEMLLPTPPSNMYSNDDTSYVGDYNDMSSRDDSISINSVSLQRHAVDLFGNAVLKNQLPSTPIPNRGDEDYSDNSPMVIQHTSSQQNITAPAPALPPRNYNPHVMRHLHQQYNANGTLSTSQVSNPNTDPNTTDRHLQGSSLTRKTKALFQFQSTRQKNTNTPPIPQYTTRELFNDVALNTTVNNFVNLEHRSRQRTIKMRLLMYARIYNPPVIHNYKYLQRSKNYDQLPLYNTIINQPNANNILYKLNLIYNNNIINSAVSSQNKAHVAPSFILPKFYENLFTSNSYLYDVIHNKYQINRPRRDICKIITISQFFDMNNPAHLLAMSGNYKLTNFADYELYTKLPFFTHQVLVHYTFTQHRSPNEMYCTPSYRVQNQTLSGPSNLPLPQSSTYSAFDILNQPDINPLTIFNRSLANSHAINTGANASRTSTSNLSFIKLPTHIFDLYTNYYYFSAPFHSKTNLSCPYFTDSLYLHPSIPPHQFTPKMLLNIAKENYYNPITNPAGTAFLGNFIREYNFNSYYLKNTTTSSRYTTNNSDDSDYNATDIINMKQPYVVPISILYNKHSKIPRFSSDYAKNNSSTSHTSLSSNCYDVQNSDGTPYQSPTNYLLSPTTVSSPTTTLASDTKAKSTLKFKKSRSKQVKHAFIPRTGMFTANKLENWSFSQQHKAFADYFEQKGVPKCIDNDGVDESGMDIDSPIVLPDHNLFQSAIVTEESVQPQQPVKKQSLTRFKQDSLLDMALTSLPAHNIEPYPINPTLLQFIERNRAVPYFYYVDNTVSPPPPQSSSCAHLESSITAENNLSRNRSQCETEELDEDWFNQQRDNLDSYYKRGGRGGVGETADNSANNTNNNSASPFPQSASAALSSPAPSSTSIDSNNNVPANTNNNLITPSDVDQNTPNSAVVVVPPRVPTRPKLPTHRASLSGLPSAFPQSDCTNIFPTPPLGISTLLSPPNDVSKLTLPSRPMSSQLSKISDPYPNSSMSLALRYTLNYEMIPIRPTVQVSGTSVSDSAQVITSNVTNTPPQSSGAAVSMNDTLSFKSQQSYTALSSMLSLFSLVDFPKLYNSTLTLPNSAQKLRTLPKTTNSATTINKLTQELSTIIKKPSLQPFFNDITPYLESFYVINSVIMYPTNHPFFTHYQYDPKAQLSNYSASSTAPVTTIVPSTTTQPTNTAIFTQTPISPPQFLDVNAANNTSTSMSNSFMNTPIANAKSPPITSPPTNTRVRSNVGAHHKVMSSLSTLVSQNKEKHAALANNNPSSTNSTLITSASSFGQPELSSSNLGALGGLVSSLSTFNAKYDSAHSTKDNFVYFAQQMTFYEPINSYTQYDRQLRCYIALDECAEKIGPQPCKPYDMIIGTLDASNKNVIGYLSSPQIQTSTNVLLSQCNLSSFNMTNPMQTVPITTPQGELVTNTDGQVSQSSTNAIQIVPFTGIITVYNNSIISATTSSYEQILLHNKQYKKRGDSARLSLQNIHKSEDSTRIHQKALFNSTFYQGLSNEEKCEIAFLYTLAHPTAGSPHSKLLTKQSIYSVIEHMLYDFTKNATVNDHLSPATKQQIKQQLSKYLYTKNILEYRMNDWLLFFNNIVKLHHKYKKFHNSQYISYINKSKAHCKSMLLSNLSYIESLPDDSTAAAPSTTSAANVGKDNNKVTLKHFTIFKILYLYYQQLHLPTTQPAVQRNTLRNLQLPIVSDAMLEYFHIKHFPQVPFEHHLSASTLFAAQIEAHQSQQEKAQEKRMASTNQTNKEEAVSAAPHLFSPAAATASPINASLAFESHQDTNISLVSSISSMPQIDTNSFQHMIGQSPFAQARHMSVTRGSGSVSGLTPAVSLRNSTADQRQMDASTLTAQQKRLSRRSRLSSHFLFCPDSDDDTANPLHPMPSNSNTSLTNLNAGSMNSNTGQGTVTVNSTSGTFSQFQANLAQSNSITLTPSSSSSFAQRTSVTFTSLPFHQQNASVVSSLLTGTENTDGATKQSTTTNPSSSHASSFTAALSLAPAVQRNSIVFDGDGIYAIPQTYHSPQLNEKEIDKNRRSRQNSHISRKSVFGAPQISPSATSPSTGAPTRSLFGVKKTIEQRPAELSPDLIHNDALNEMSSISRSHRAKRQTLITQQTPTQTTQQQSRNIVNENSQSSTSPYSNTTTQLTPSSQNRNVKTLLSPQHPLSQSIDLLSPPPSTTTLPIKRDRVVPPPPTSITAVTTTQQSQPAINPNINTCGQLPQSQ